MSVNLRCIYSMNQEPCCVWMCVVASVKLPRTVTGLQKSIFKLAEMHLTNSCSDASLSDNFKMRKLFKHLGMVFSTLREKVVRGSVACWSCEPFAQPGPAFRFARVERALD